MKRIIKRITGFSRFMIDTFGFRLSTMKALGVWLTLLATKKLVIRGWMSNEHRNRMKAIDITLTRNGKEFRCKYGHVNIIEENWLGSNEIHISPDKIIMDCGANIGIFAMFHPMNNIYCIEPDPKNLELLKFNLVEHQIHPILYGIGDKKERVAFAVTVSGIGSHVGPLFGKTQSPKDHHIPIYLTTIDHLVKEYKIRPDFIKIDVEGYEMKALTGAKNTCNRWHPEILVEMHDDKYFRLCKKILVGYGYSDFSIHGNSIYARKKQKKRGML